MSADNTIVILHLLDQSRVSHLQAMEDLYFSIEEGREMPFPVASRVVERFRGGSALLEDKAREYALVLQEKIGYVEYGIVEIYINKTWEQLVRESWSLLEKEVQTAYNQHNESCRTRLLNNFSSLLEILKSEELKIKGV
jgi:hypothetical protein